MAAMTSTEIAQAGRLLGLNIFVIPKATARFGFNELKTIITTIDNMFEANASTFTQTDSIAKNIHDALQALDLGTGVAALSISEESEALKAWTNIKYG